MLLVFRPNFENYTAMECQQFLKVKGPERKGVYTPQSFHFHIESQAWS